MHQKRWGYVYCRYLWLLLGLLLIGTLTQWGCGGRAAGGGKGGYSSSPLIRAVASGGIKRLDDPHSPYAGRYREWDNWIAQHCVCVSTGWTQQMTRTPGTSEIVFQTTVDGNGFVLPLLEYYRQREAASSRTQRERFQMNSVFVTALGEMESAEFDQTRAAIAEIIASFYPKIPDWLAQKPPKKAVLLPNGDIATYGPLGSGLTLNQANGGKKTEPTKEGCCGGNDPENGWYRYSSTGEPLGFTNRGHWWYLYYDLDLSGPTPGDDSLIQGDGYTVCRDKKSGDVLAIYDWDGALLDTTVPPERDAHSFTALKPSAIIMYHQAQVRTLKNSA